MPAALNEFEHLRRTFCVVSGGRFVFHVVELKLAELRVFGGGFSYRDTGLSLQLQCRFVVTSILVATKILGLLNTTH